MNNSLTIHSLADELAAITGQPVRVTHSATRNDLFAGFRETYFAQVGDCCSAARVEEADIDLELLRKKIIGAVKDADEIKAREIAALTKQAERLGFTLAQKVKEAAA